MEPTPVSAILRDREGLEAFYLEHLEWVRRFVARRVDDADTAADLTADIFVAAIGAAARHQERGRQPRAWLAGIARNVVAMHHRGRSREHAANALIEGRALLDESATEQILARIDDERAARLVLARLVELPVSQLDSFETQLLQRLYEHREHAMATASRRRTTRRRLVAAAGVAAATVASVVLIPGLGPQAAYSVSEENSGEIVVEVRRIEDAPGLEAALAEYGVASDISYLPYGQECAPERYRTVERQSSGLRVSMGSDLLRIVLPPGTVRDAETLVMWVSGREMTSAELDALDREEGTTEDSGFTSSFQLDIATGPVGPCRVVPAR